MATAPDLWAQLLDATYPPGSVSGAPKSSALRIIDELEPEARGPYCGAVGWIEVGEDGRVRAELAVGIRTFWWSDGVLRFGTGAGITWGSDPAGGVGGDRAQGGPARRPRVQRRRRAGDRLTR